MSSVKLPNTTYRQTYNEDNVTERYDPMGSAGEAAQSAGNHVLGAAGVVVMGVAGTADAASKLVTGGREGHEKTGDLWKAVVLGPLGTAVGAAAYLGGAVVAGAEAVVHTLSAANPFSYGETVVEMDSAYFFDRLDKDENGQLKVKYLEVNDSFTGWVEVYEKGLPALCEYIKIPQDVRQRMPSPPQG